jgi:hypothetical protein
MSAWNDLVKKTFQMGKAKNSTYKLKDAMKEARKFYKKGTDAASGVVKNVIGRRATAKKRSNRRRSGRK